MSPSILTTWSCIVHCRSLAGIGFSPHMDNFDIRKVLKVIAFLFLELGLCPIALQLELEM